SRALQQRLGEALRELSGPAEWWPVTDALQRCAKPGYQRAKQDLQSQLLAHRGKDRQQLHAELAELEEANTRYETLRAARHAYSPETWLERWEGIRQMAQELAGDYWAAYTTPQRAGQRAHALPALTSARRTYLPSSNAARALIQSFGPGVQQSLWNID